MPPFSNYGVLVGTKTDYKRDNIALYGKYYHGNIRVKANNETYQCAIDVDSKVTRVQWRIINFSANEFSIISKMTEGWNHLKSNEFSGAIDYIRWPLMWVVIEIRIPLLFPWKIKIPNWLYSPKLKSFKGVNIQISDFFRLFIVEQSSYWMIGDNIHAIEQLESVLNQGNKVFIFGEFFNDGTNGVHNIHQNQGDPPNIKQAKNNGIWQDGATIVQKSDGNFVGFFNKFATQSFKTDNEGHPI
jgi:hypothetical protein